MRAKRETRNSETRDANQRRMPQTRHVGNLSLPDSVLRDGKKRRVVFRWIAEAVNNQPHPNGMNVQGRLMNGWKPVMAEQYPDLCPPLLPGQEQSAIIRRGGLILVEMPQHMYDDERQELTDRNIADLQQVNWADGPIDPRMPREELVNRVDISQVETRPGPQFKE